MEQYISKSALLAEIERLVNNYDKALDYEAALEDVRDFIDTLELKEVDVWKTVDNINPPQADRNKIYCVLSKNKYLLVTVINHPQDEDLLQWKCTEFPFHRYDMCEGDKYMQIV